MIMKDFWKVVSFLLSLFAFVTTMLLSHLLDKFRKYVPEPTTMESMIAHCEEELPRTEHCKIEIKAVVDVKVPN